MFATQPLQNHNSTWNIRREMGKKKSLKQKQNWLISLLPKPRKPLSVNKQQTSWRKGGVVIPFQANGQIHKLVWAGPSSATPANWSQGNGRCYSNIPDSTGATRGQGASAVLVTPSALMDPSYICWKAVTAAGMIHFWKPQVCLILWRRLASIPSKEQERGQARALA